MNSSTYGCSVCAKEAKAKSARLVDADVFSELSKTLPEHIKIESVEFDEQARSSRIKIHCDIHGSILQQKVTLLVLHTNAPIVAKTPWDTQVTGSKLLLKEIALEELHLLVSCQ